MKCRDCDAEGRPFGHGGIRSDICASCMEVRGKVIKALQEGKMTMTDFQKYQRNGLRTKRLVKMGYGHLVEPAP